MEGPYKWNQDHFQGPQGHDPRPPQPPEARPLRAKGPSKTDRLDSQVAIAFSVTVAGFLGKVDGKKRSQLAIQEAWGGCRGRVAHSQGNPLLSVFGLALRVRKRISGAAVGAGLWWF